MLTGPELLAKVKELGQAPRDQVAIACGYTRKDGKPSFTAFFEALTAAHGLPLAPVAGKAKKGKPLSFAAKVAKSGTVPITAGYTRLIGAEPEDSITIEHDGDRLILRKAVATVTATPVEVEEVEITPPAAERELVGAGAERTPF